MLTVDSLPDHVIMDQTKHVKILVMVETAKAVIQLHVTLNPLRHANSNDYVEAMLLADAIQQITSVEMGRRIVRQVIVQYSHQLVLPKLAVPMVQNVAANQMDVDDGYHVGHVVTMSCVTPMLTNAILNKYAVTKKYVCLLYTSPSPRDGLLSRMPSSA